MSRAGMAWEELLYGEEGSPRATDKASPRLERKPVLLGDGTHTAWLSDPSLTL